MSGQWTSLPGPTEVRRLGPSYEATSGDAHLRLDHLHEGRDELTAELTVQLDDRHVSQARFNLSSLTARNSQAKYLSVVDETVPWRQILEELCLEVLRQHRAGDEVLSLNGQYADTNPFPPVLPPLLTHHRPTILFGEGGAGKSTIAAAAALSLETGVEVIPGMLPSPSKVLVLDWEDQPEVWGGRLHELAKGAGIDQPGVDYQRQRRPFVEQAERVAAQCARDGVEVVVIDSMGMAMGAGKEHGSAEDSAIQMFGALALLDCTVLIIDHVRGDALGSEKAVSRPYGSVYKTNLARSVFELKREREPVEGRSEVMLVHTKSNLGRKLAPIGLAMVYEPGEIRIVRSEITAVEMQAARSLGDRMKGVLAGGARTTAEVASELDVPDASVRQTLRRDPRFVRIGTRLIGLKA